VLRLSWRRDHDAVQLTIIMSLRLRKKIEHLLGGCDVNLNGNAPWDIQVLNEDLYAVRRIQRALVQNVTILPERQRRVIPCT
jgi:hypothetical protein